ncbi:hypothetical protein ACHQM5_021422 [Ranunculus cassubicifolius]
MDAEIHNFNLLFSHHPSISQFTKQINHIIYETQKFIFSFFLSFIFFRFITGKQWICSDHGFYRNVTIAAVLYSVVLNLSVLWRLYVYSGKLKFNYLKVRRSAGILFDEIRGITKWNLMMRYFLLEISMSFMFLVVTVTLGNGLIVYYDRMC